MTIEAQVREATKADRPQGAESQCVLCWRLFGSDSTCEAHKPYRRPVTAECKEPSTVGLEWRERRGLAVWVRPMPSHVSEMRRERNGAQYDGDRDA